MGEYFRQGTCIRDFTPDETNEMFFLEGEFGDFSLEVLLEKAVEKWGNVANPRNIMIRPQYIHTRCLGYDQYDPCDYDNFLQISIDRSKY